MSLHDELVTQLGRYDDDTWAALTSRGLVRRAAKDLASVEVSQVRDDGRVVEIAVGPHRVLFDTRGPAQATCSCPSHTTCQHIVTAGLWLAAQVAGGEFAGATPPAPATTDQHAQLMALDTAALTKHASAAGYRWARQVLDDLDPERDVRITTDRHTVVTLAHPAATVRFLGEGLGGIVTDVRVRAVEKYHVAAVLAYQRAHGAEAAPLATPAPRSGPELLDSRNRLRDSVTRLLLDTVQLGVSHLSPAVHERYETLAVWAQGAEYYRLALMLRRLADEVELLLARSARADEERLLDETAISYALVSALTAAASAGQAPPALVGQARGRYDAVRSVVELIGLGSVPWHSASGYRGLTSLFWWPAAERFVSWTDARPETVGGFDPRARREAVGPWTGLSSPAAASGARVRLTGAQVSAGGRVSGAERTSATVATLTGAQVAAAVPVSTSWSTLVARKTAGLSLLDASDPLADWVVVAPTRCGVARFDGVRQTLLWPVEDDAGAVLTLTLPYSAVTAVAIAHLESLTRAGLPHGTLIVARLRSRSAGLTAEPLSLVHPGRGDSPLVELHFPDHAAAAGEGGATGGSVRSAPGPDPATHSPTGMPGAQSTLPLPLVELQTWLTRQAERGTGSVVGAARDQLLGHLRTQHAAVRSLGLELFPAEPGPDLDVAILRSRFLALQVAALISGEAPGGD